MSAPQPEDELRVLVDKALGWAEWLDRGTRARVEPKLVAVLVELGDRRRSG